MSIKKVLIGISAGMVIMGTLAHPTLATNKRVNNMRSFSLSTIGNTVGTVSNIDSSIYVKGSYIDIHCDSVRRIQIIRNFFEDRQSCKIISPENFPSRPAVLLFSSKGENCPEEGNDQCWYSDYVYATTGGYQLSIGGTRIIKPNGTVEIISFYRT